MEIFFSADHFTTILLLAVVMAIVRWERQLYNTFLSPAFFMMVPYTLLVMVINFVAVYFGYFTVSYMANLLVMIFFILFFLVGLVIRQLFPQHQLIKEEGLHEAVINSDEFESYYRLIAIVAILAGVLQFRQVIGQIGLVNVGSPLFKQLYGGGILSHIMLLSRPAFFFLFAIAIRRWNGINFFILLAIFSMVVVPQVKYQIIVIIVAAVIYGINLRVIKVTIRKSVVAILLIYFLFNISYVIGFSASGLDYAYSDKVQAFLFNHFFTYLFGGPIGFSEILKMQQYPYFTIVELLAVPTNIYKAIIGDSQYVEIIIHHWLPISTITQYFHSTNTFGLFGMLYAYAGIAGAGLFTMLYAGLAYTIFQFSLLRRGNVAFQMAYAYIGAYLVLSFFGLYLNMMPFYEVLIYILVLQFTIQGMKKLNIMSYELNSENG